MTWMIQTRLHAQSKVAFGVCTSKSSSCGAIERRIRVLGAGVMRNKMRCFPQTAALTEPVELLAASYCSLPLLVQFSFDNLRLARCSIPVWPSRALSGSMVLHFACIFNGLRIIFVGSTESRHRNRRSCAEQTAEISAEQTAG